GLHDAQGSRRFLKSHRALAPHPRRAAGAARRVVRGALVTLPPRPCSPDQSAGIVRVRTVIQIDETLAMCVSDPREIALWFRTVKAVAPFFGRTPLALLFRGMTGFKAIAGYLAAWH